MSVKSLDWFDALAQDGIPNVEATLSNMKPELVLGADIVSKFLFCCSDLSQRHTCAQLYHPDMIAPFLATLNIALRASKLRAGGTAYLALTVRSADLLNLFLLALCEPKSFAWAIS